LEDEEENALSNEMKDPEVKVYVQFVCVFFKKINMVNQFFQAEASQIFEARDQLVKSYLSFSNHIFKQKIELQVRFDIDLNKNEEFLMTDDQIYQHFTRIFYDQIHLNTLKQAQAIGMCRNFKKFILALM